MSALRIETLSKGSVVYIPGRVRLKGETTAASTECRVNGPQAFLGHMDKSHRKREGEDAGGEALAQEGRQDACHLLSLENEPVKPGTKQRSAIHRSEQGHQQPTLN